jgi:hypothetical protein
MNKVTTQVQVLTEQSVTNFRQIQPPKLHTCGSSYLLRTILLSTYMLDGLKQRGEGAACRVKYLVLGRPAESARDAPRIEAGAHADPEKRGCVWSAQVASPRSGRHGRGERHHRRRHFHELVSDISPSSLLTLSVGLSPDPNGPFCLG